MNWLGLFRKSTPPPAAERPALEPAPMRPAVAPTQPPLVATSPPTPEEIRRVLFDAVASGDEGRLESLCQEHQDFILAHGTGWLDVPAAFRSSPEAYQWYGNGLQAIARFCADKLGRTDVLEPLATSTRSTTVPH